jgi:hypothetical protein
MRLQRTFARFHPDRSGETLPPGDTYRLVLPPGASRSFTVDPSELAFTDNNGGSATMPFYHVDLSVLRVVFVNENGVSLFESNSLFRAFSHKVVASIDGLKGKLQQRIPSFEIPEPMPLSIVLEDILGPETDVTDIRMYDKTVSEILERVLGPLGLEAKISGLNVVTARARTVTTRFPLTRGELNTLMEIFRNPREVKDGEARQILFESLGAENDEQTVWLLPEEQSLIVADTKWNLGRVEKFLRESVYEPDGI